MLAGTLAAASVAVGAWAAWHARGRKDKAAWEQAAGLLLVAGLALLGVALSGAGLRPG